MADQPVALTEAAMLMMWGTTVAMMAITIDPWFAIAACVYFAAFLFAMHSRGNPLYAAAVANATFTVNAVVRWRPATLEMTPEERASWEARVRR
jgi:hypothetical protein